jgi:hypothetical protein
MTAPSWERAGADRRKGTGERTRAGETGQVGSTLPLVGERQLEVKPGPGGREGGFEGRSLVELGFGLKGADWDSEAARTERWNRPIKDWPAALYHLSIVLPGRVPP